MPRNGSGVYVRPFNWVADRDASIPITASRFDSEDDDIGAALTASIANDGQTPIVANLPMSGFRHTGAGAGVAATDYATLNQVQGNPTSWVAAGGTADAFTATYAPAVTTLTDGMLLRVRASAANATTTPTFAPNGLTARTITRFGGQALSVGDIFGAGHELLLVYRLSATRWELLNPTTTPTLSPYAGFKSQLRNGDYNVWQRGAAGAASIAVIGGASSVYTVDRWALTTPNNAAATVSQQAGLTNGSQWCARVQRNNGQTGTGFTFFEHAFTLDQIIPMRGQIMTVSFYARCGANYSPASSSMGISLITGTGAARTFGSIAYTGEVDCISTSTTLSTSIAKVTATGTVVVPTNTTQMALVVFMNSTGTAGAADYFEIDEAQLEVGSTATVFDRRPFEIDLKHCKRFYQKSFPYATAPAQTGGVTGAFNVFLGTGQSGTNGATILLEGPMYQTVQTFTTYNPSAGNANVRDTTNSADRTITVGTKSDSSVPFSFAAGAAASTNAVHWTADAELA